MSNEFSMPDHPFLFGTHPDQGLIAIEHEARAGRPEAMTLFFRRGGAMVRETEPFTPFILADVHAIAGCPVEYRARPLAGPGRLNVCAEFGSWKDCERARKWLGDATGLTAGAPGAPYLFLSDPTQQHLMTTGRTSFRGMAFEDLHRLQIDIECFTSPGYEFCHPDREDDRIIAIALSDQSGWCEVLSGSKRTEKELLERWVAIVCERDPDVIEGHNLFNFDLPYLAARAQRHGVKLTIGRDGRVPSRRSSRVSWGERTVSYDRFDIAGRHVIDTLFLVQAYDQSRRDLDSYGLKDVAVHFGLASDTRTYIDGPEISGVFDRDPERLERYVRDDVLETRALSDLLSRSHFVQAQMLPYTYQNVAVRGNATKIDALMIREYLRRGQAVPLPDEPREFAGGYTDMFVEGLVENVHHGDIRSLYPSLMLTRHIRPASDTLGVFTELLDALRTLRLEAKTKMATSRTPVERAAGDALQGAFKILINSFYGYLGFSQGKFSDFTAAETVAAEGRRLLTAMVEWLRQHGATPIEIDTDGIYFVPPASAARDMEAFRAAFAASLPEGIEIEFDGEYRSMYSYKMKNYALLGKNGEVVIKGAALKSRGLEPFLRDFLRELIRCRLEQREADMAALKASFEDDIRERRWPIARLAKTETLQDSPETYAAKRRGNRRSRSAVYELALASGREYRAGDQLSYYVTGSRKNVAVHEAARRVSDWSPDARDENVPYYLAKLEALYAKFGVTGVQPELDLG